jgi:hypothetical protein
MAKKQPYKQCKLVRKEGSSTHIEVSYIPTEFAKQGETVKLKQADGSWEDGWVVESVGAEASADAVNAMYNSWKRWRKVTDLPQGTFKDHSAQPV